MAKGDVKDIEKIIKCSILHSKNRDYGLFSAWPLKSAITLILKITLQAEGSCSVP